MPDQDKSRAELIAEINQLRSQLAAINGADDQVDPDLDTQFRFMVETTGYVLYRLRYDSMTYDYLSLGITSLTGYTPEELEALGLYKIIEKFEMPGGVGLNPEEVALERLAGRTGEYRAEYLLRTKDDKLRWVSDHSFPWNDSEGRLLGSVGILADMTRLRRAEDGLRKAKAEAEEAWSARSKFLARLSRKIRNPLNSCLGMTELAATTEPGAEQQCYLQDARLAVGELLSDLNSALDLAKLEAGLMALDIQDFNLRELFDEVLEIIAPAVSEKSLELIGIVSPDTPYHFRGDPLRLKQILLQLLDNAVKFTDQGEVILRLGPDTVSEEGVTIHIEVADTGLGIRPSRLEEVFDGPLEDDNPALKRRQGIGLGLGLCRHLVELMGGRIRIESLLGRGTSIHLTLTLPLAVSVPDQEVIKDEHLTGRKALIVDSHPTSGLILNEYVTSLGMDSTQTKTAREALFLISDGYLPEVIITSDELPESGGRDLISKVREGADSKVPAIIISALGSREEVAESGNRDKIFYVPKPIIRDDFRQTIGLALAKPVRPPKPKGLDADNPDLNVLVVEDNEISRRLVITVLERGGHRVTAVENGGDAIEAFKGGGFDIILMDVEMPMMNGLEATRAIREMENEEARIPIIGLTAHALKGDRERCLEAGMDDYLPKPFEFKDMFDLIHRLVEPGPPPEA